MASEFAAKHYSLCPICTRKVRPGQIVRIEFESRQTAHASCVGALASERHQEDEEYEARVEEYRQRIMAVKCPRCAAPPKARCRELGVERAPVHRQRVNEWRRVEKRRTRMLGSVEHH